MPGRTRPVEKLAEAVAKCAAEVDTPTLGKEQCVDWLVGLRLWEMYCGGLQCRI